jgi:hypothetical protein
MKKALTTLLLGWFARLRFPTLLTITGVLFVVNIFMPDLVPFVDEILLGLVTLVLANWKKRDGDLPGAASESGSQPAPGAASREPIDVEPTRGGRGNPRQP